MPTDLDLANVALALLGESPLASLSDDRKAATVVAPRIALVRDALLRSHPWNFAITRAALAVVAEAPAFGYSYAFALPTDYLRVMQVNDGRTHYEIERQGPIRVLLANDSSVNLRYISRVENPSAWDPLFFEAMAAALALDSCMAILGSDTDAYSRTRSLFVDRLELARSMDGQENTPGEAFDDDFLSAWHGGSHYRSIGEPT